MQGLARATRRLTGAGRRAVATLTSTLGAQVDTLGDKDFLRVRHQDITWTLGEFQRHANALAEGLAEAGYRPGDTIAVWLPNDSEYLVTQFAAARLGLTFIAVDPAVEGAANVASVLRTSGCKGFLFGADGIDAVSGAVPELDAQGAESGSIKSLEFGGLAHLVTTGWHFERHGVENFKNLPVYSADALRDGFRATNVLAAIAPPAAGSALGAHFTASADGEGPPQMGAAFSHGAAVTQGTAVADTLKLTGDDVVCITAPLASPLGFAGVAGALSRTAKTVVPAADFDAVATMDAIAIEGCTVLIAEPEQLAELEALCASGAYATASVPSRRLLTL